jgi:hypothetical protein
MTSCGPEINYCPPHSFPTDRMTLALKPLRSLTILVIKISGISMATVKTATIKKRQPVVPQATQVKL